MSRTFWRDQRVIVLAAAKDNRQRRDQRDMQRELVAVQQYVSRLAWAATLGNDVARRRLRELSFNRIGAEAARLAEAALAEIDRDVRAGRSIAA